MKSLMGFLGKSLSFVVFNLPVSIQLFLGDCIGILWWDILRVRRDVVLGNLEIAFPEMRMKEKNRIARTSLRYLGRGFIEYFKFPFLNKDNVGKWVRLEGLEHLDEAKKQGNGVCIMGGHFGNGDLCLAGLSLNGYDVLLISKLFKMEWLNELWFGLRSKMGTRFIPPRNSTSEIIKSLRANRMVIFVQDQFMGPPIGCRVRFFGKETGSAMGLAMIARRTKSPVVPVMQFRDERDQHIMKFYPPIPYETLESKEETVQHMTQKYTDYIEDQVKQNPELWMWVHRRWKPFKGQSQKKRHGVVAQS